MTARSAVPGRAAAAGQAGAAPAGPEAAVPAYELYYRALSGRTAAIELIAPGGALAFPDTATTLRLPAVPQPADAFKRDAGQPDAGHPDAGQPDAPVAARAWYRVALAHRALHHEAGTFGFRADRAGRLRPLLSGKAAGRGDLEAFFGSFADRRLALQVFQVVEDLRIDTILARRHPGLAVTLKTIFAAELAARPPLASMAPRTGALEVLLRRSLGHVPATAPAPIAGPVAALLAAAAIAGRPGAMVEDAARAAVHAYAVLTRLPNLGRLAGAPARPAWPELAGPLPWPRDWPEPPRAAIEGSAILDVPVAGVGFRDDLSGHIWRAPGAPVPDQQAVYIWRSGPATGTARTGAGAPGDAAGPPEPLPHEHHEVARDLRKQETGALAPAGPHTFVYPEWDDRRGAFLPRWCRVAERPMPPAGVQAANRLQRRHAFLLGRLRRLMQQAPLEGLETQRRVTDGDDIDFDAAVEALTDLRAGRPPGEACYQRLRRRRRQVAVGFLVDASSSTGERAAGAAPLDPESPGSGRAGPQSAPSPVSPQSPVSPPGAVSAQRPVSPPAAVSTAASGWRTWPRVLDIEIAATLLCLTAADAADDTTAAWAFSGTGRESVLMPVLKSPREPFSGRVIRRMAAVKPVHATRIGAAIRHATARLAGVPAATRLLLVLSDGCPYDVDYGQQYGDGYAAAYAAADTAHAVAEARGSGVRPFLLTMDRGAGDLARACPQDCEILGDISALPQRLTRLYRGLAADS